MLDQHPNDKFEENSSSQRKST